MANGTTYELVVRPELPAGSYLVVGLDRSGQAAAKLLVALGHRVVAVDEAAPEGTDTLADFGVEVHLGVDLERYVEQAEVVILGGGLGERTPMGPSPTVLSEFELGWRLLANPFVAVVGGDGQARRTTVELLAQTHRDAGLPVVIGGDDVPLCALVDNIDPGATIACSFAGGESGDFTPECGVLIDACDDEELAIFAGQRAGQFAVIAPGLDFEIPGEGRHYRVPAPDLAKLGDSIALAATEDKLRAVVATQAAMLMGIDPYSISRTLSSFVGPPAGAR